MNEKEEIISRLLKLSNEELREVQVFIRGIIQVRKEG